MEEIQSIFRLLTLHEIGESEEEARKLVDDHNQLEAKAKVVIN